MRNMLAVMLLLSAATVEAADVKVALRSDPPGAMVYTGPLPAGSDQVKAWGYAPLVLKWAVPRRWNSCLQTEPIRVRWLSGAEATIPSLQLCPQTGKNQQFTFMRPTGVPGVEIDGQFAVQLLQQAPAAPAAVYAPSPQPVHCTSTLIGRQVFTNCY